MVFLSSTCVLRSSRPVGDKVMWIIVSCSILNPITQRHNWYQIAASYIPNRTTNIKRPDPPGWLWDVDKIAKLKRSEKKHLPFLKLGKILSQVAIKLNFEKVIKNKGIV